MQTGVPLFEKLTLLGEDPGLIGKGVYGEAYLIPNASVVKRYFLPEDGASLSLTLDFTSAGVKELACLLHLAGLKVPRIPRPVSASLKFLEPSELTMTYTGKEFSGEAFSGLELLSRAREFMRIVLKTLLVGHVVNGDLKLAHILRSDEDGLSVIDWGLGALVLHSHMRLRTQIYSLWQRPPELISADSGGFNQEAAEMWAAGVVLLNLGGTGVFPKENTRRSMLDAVFQVFGPPPEGTSFRRFYIPPLMPVRPTSPADLLAAAQPVDVDPVFADFVNRLLLLDPASRLTPEQAVTHPFIIGDDAWSCVRTDGESRVIHAPTSTGMWKENLPISIRSATLEKLLGFVSFADLNPETFLLAGAIMDVIHVTTPATQTRSTYGGFVLSAFVLATCFTEPSTLNLDLLVDARFATSDSLVGIVKQASSMFAIVQNIPSLWLATPFALALQGMGPLESVTAECVSCLRYLACHAMIKGEAAYLAADKLALAKRMLEVTQSVLGRKEIPRCPESDGWVQNASAPGQGLKRLSRSVPRVLLKWISAPESGPC